MDNEIINDDDLEIEEGFLEEEIENISMSSSDDDYILPDAVKNYIKSLGNYKLLSLEEEEELVANIQDPENNKLLVPEQGPGMTLYVLDINLLLSSLSGTRDYNKIIDSIINSYSMYSKSSNQKYINFLNKYRSLCNRIGRSLTKEELNEYLGVTTNKELLEEKKLFAEVKKYILYKTSIDRLYTSNLRLVVSFARRYKNKSDFLDVIEEGNIGLLRGITKYRLNKGTKLSTYSAWWIKQAIIRYSAINRSSMHIPCHMEDKLFKYNKAVVEFETEYGHKPTNSELSNILELPINVVKEIAEINQEEVRLDQPFGEEGDMTFKDTLVASDDVEELVVSKSIYDDMEVLYEVLTFKEKRIIELLYGLNGCGNGRHSLKYVGDILGITPERVRQLENRALMKMRRVANYSKNKEFTNILKTYIK